MSLPTAPTDQRIQNFYMGQYIEGVVDGRIKPPKHKNLRNKPCPCGRGKKFKLCCADKKKIVYKK